MRDEVGNIQANGETDRQTLLRTSQLAVELAEVVEVVCGNKAGGFVGLGRHKLCDSKTVRELKTDAEIVRGRLPQPEETEVAK